MILTIFTSIFNFVGALAILLWGMDLLSTGIQKGAGDKLQKLLSVISGNRFTAVLTGLFVTAVIQSSGATTVMVVSFVNAQILSLTQAIGIIFGANIGTTVTAWIVSLLGFSFKISAIAIPLVGVGFFLKTLKKSKIKDFADMVMGFGLLFLGLDFLGDTLSFGPESVGFINGISNYGFLGIILGVIIGAGITALIHSSSAFTAIVLTMAANGLLTWEFSAVLVLGSNIGSTIDAILASLGATTNAKRTALVHVLFNIFGTVLAIIFLKPLLNLVDFIVPNVPEANITTHIAMLHTVFNVCSTIVFLPFVNQIAALVTKLIKEPPVSEEEHYKVPVIITKKQSTIDVYVVQIEREISRMTAKVMSMLDTVHDALVGYDEKTTEEDYEQLIKAEAYIDEMNEAISNFLMECFHMADTDSPIQKKIEKLLQVTNSVEDLSDECATILYKLKKYILENSNHKSSSYEKLLPYMNQVKDFFDYVNQHLVIGLTSQERQLSVEMENNIDKTKRELKKLARYRIQEGKDVKSELHYIDIVRHLEKAGDCVFGIVKSL
jgi:phosphate:Na+ symporter